MGLKQFDLMLIIIVALLISSKCLIVTISNYAALHCASCHNIKEGRAGLVIMQNML